MPVVMIYHEQSEDYQPLFWVQGRPVFANTLILFLHIAAFIGVGLCIAYLGEEPVFQSLALIPESIWHEGQVWRFFSYITFDPSFVTQRSLWFLISMLMLYFFGREVEQFVGRRHYLLLYASVVLIPAILYSVVGLFFPLGYYLNSGDLFFGIFVAFATIYPGVMPSMWLPVTARVLMWILLAISTLVDLMVRDFGAIFMLWTCSATAFLVMRLVGAGHGLNWLTDWLDERRNRRLARNRQFKVVREKKATESLDAILDKISKHGVASLNSQERAVLEEARTNLLKRDER
jgi:membrane associated rhomboid family serine protease